MTTLKTFKAEIKGLFKIVNQMYNVATGEISYEVNGRPVSADKFWRQKPVIVG